MFKRYLILILALFCGLSEAADIRAPFSGARITGLTRTTTIGEWNSTIDSSGNLVDISGSNYFKYSEQFDNATWTKNPGTASITANVARAPDGTNTADLFNEGTAGSGDAAQSVQQQPTLVTGTYTQSIYIKYKASGRSWIYMGCAGAANKYAWFNIQTGAVGTVQSLVSNYKIRPIAGGWYKVSVTTTDTTPGSTWIFRAAEADNDTTYTGDNRGAFYIWGAQLAQNDTFRVGSGIYHQTIADNKPVLDLAPSNGPTESKSYLQTQDGRRLKTRTFASSSTQYYSKASDASMNIVDSNFTYTSVFKLSGASATATLIRRAAGGGGGGGFSVYADSTPSYYIKIEMWKSDGTSVILTGPSVNLNDGYYHIVQIKRTSDIVYILLDGVASASVNRSTYGADTSTALYIGTGFGAWNGDILYTRLDAEALTDTQLNYEREVIRGTLFGSGNINPNSTFSRTTSSATVVGTATQVQSDGTIGYVAHNTPRVSGDGGGIIIEESRINSVLQSQTFGTTWGTSNASVSTDALTAPDGTTTADGFIADVNDVVHYLTQAVANSNVKYTFSIYGKSGNKTKMFLNNNGVALGNAVFDLDSCLYLGGGADVASTTVVQMGGGWCRMSATWTLPAASNTVYFGPVNSLADWDFAGDGVTVNIYLWGAQLEAGAHPTSYIPTTSAAITRVADNFTFKSWSISKNMFAAGTPTMWYNFDQMVYSGNTVTTSGGGYTLTTAGNPKLYSLPNDSTYTNFDGLSDYFTFSSSSLYPATTNFSIVAIITPSSVSSGTTTIMSTLGSDGSYYELDQVNDGIVLKTYDGTAPTSTTKASCLVTNKTSLITVTFTRAPTVADSVCNIYVDGLSVATSSSMRKIGGSFSSGSIARWTGGGQPFYGNLHFLAYYDHGIGGTVLSQTQHDTMYSNLKDARALPVKIGTSYEAKKLYIEFETKCEFSSTSDVGQIRQLLNVSGNTGTADSDTNRISLRVLADGSLRFSLYPASENTERFATLAAQTDYNKWNKYTIYINFSDLTLSTVYKGTNSFSLDGATMTGAKDFDLTNVLVRAGQDYDDTINGNCSIRNLSSRIGY